MSRHHVFATQAAVLSPFSRGLMMGHNFTSGPNHNPHDQRWMLFVDGENITMRAQEAAGASGLTLETGSFWQRDVFVWFRGTPARGILHSPPHALPLQHYAVRATYYTSMCGDEDALLSVRQKLASIGFTATVLKKKSKDRRAKGVDISMTKDALMHAYHDHYDVAVIASGDGDYVPLVEELQRMGKAVHVAAFESGLSDDLRLACDHFYALDNRLSSLPRVEPAA